MFLLINGSVIKTFCPMKCEFTPFVLKKKKNTCHRKKEELFTPFPDTVAVVLNLDQPELPPKRSKNLGINLIPGTTN